MDAGDDVAGSETGIGVHVKETAQYMKCKRCDNRTFIEPSVS